jgi:uncharacterized membrane protein YeiH
MPPAENVFSPDLILALNLAGTFVAGLSGGLAAVRARLDIFGVIVLAAVVGLSGGIVRDVLIGVPPATFRDWRYLVAAGSPGLVAFYAGLTIDRLRTSVLLVDAGALGIFCVTGATKALDYHLGPAQAVLLGAITGIGGGILRDVLLREVPVVLRQDLYAVPALLGAGVLVTARKLGVSSPFLPAVAAAICIVVRVLAIQYRVDAPIAPGERRVEAEGEEEE